MYNKTIIRYGFCDIQNNHGLRKSYQPSASAGNSYLDLDYSEATGKYWLFSFFLRFLFTSHKLNTTITFQFSFLSFLSQREEKMTFRDHDFYLQKKAVSS